jgi:hypothetical protein
MNATVHSRAPAAPVIWVHVASDRELVAVESPPHCMSAVIRGNTRVGTYKTVGDTKSDGANDGDTNNGKFDDRVPQ